ncbi:MAG: B/F/G family RNA polymerase sigma-70 factor [Clostridiales bacterium]|nr:MAG: B/F/G family RNA polymerase sigma-70 factor [Clostridiales bacterium]
MTNKYENIDSKELFRLFSESKDYQIRDELFNRYVYIAEILSKKYINKGIDYEDIYQVACMGLLFAIDRFDIERGYEFSSFATPTIVGEIKKHFRDKGWTIRVPRRIQELSKKITIAKERLTRKLGRTPNIQDISEYLKADYEEIIEAMEASKVYTPKSLDIDMEGGSDDRDVKLMDIVGKIDKNYEMVNNRDFIDKIMDKLNPIERKIIEDRFFNDKTQIKVANELNVSQMTVSRLEKKIIEKFRKEYKTIINT